MSTIKKVIKRQLSFDEDEQLFWSLLFSMHQDNLDHVKTIDHVFETYLMVENRKSICLFNMYFKYEVSLHQVFITPSWTVLACCSKLFLYLKSSSHSEQVRNFSFFSCKRQIHITTMCGNSRIFEILQSNDWSPRINPVKKVL